MGRVIRFWLAAAVLCLMPPAASAGPEVLLPGQSALTLPGEPLLQKADIFRKCQNIAGRWRCRDCEWVRRCDRTGCYWEEKCRWGPPVSPIPQ